MKVKDKRYIILGYSQKEDKYYGYVEHSFSMGAHEDRVKVYGIAKYRYSDDVLNGIMQKCKDEFKKGKTKLNPNSYNQHLWFELRETAERLTRQKYNDCVWKVYRVGSKDCPVTVDFTELNLMFRGKMKYDKFIYRNQPFKRK